MLRGIVNRAVGGLLLAIYIVLVGGCGTTTQPAQTLAESATVSGTVLSVRDGLPLVDAKVRIGSIIAHVDKAGEFVMVVPAGTHQCTILAQGYESYTDQVVVAPGGNDLGEVRLFELPPPPPAF
ncbi:MAG: hypothetical protein JSV65_16895 [Armatimonadota bacterium]|nr:MAG: hypothetical protein JSV65_16895 [Armatimonadota bacterium]